MKISELTTKVNSYEVTDPTKQVSAEEYNTILKTVQEHDVTLPETVAKVEELEDKVITTENIEDSIKDLSVKDLTGVIEATPEEFNFRPSAGDKSIRDESAVIRSIKGNSLVWNQKLQNTKFSSTGEDGWYYRLGNSKASISEGRIILSFDSEELSNAIFNQKVNLRKGHIYLIVVREITTDYLPDNFNRFGVFSFSNSLNGSNVTVGTIYSTTSEVAVIYTASEDHLYFGGRVRGNIIEGANKGALSFNKPTITDLTKMFGSGNEPSTIEDFYARIPQGIDIYSYNEGQIINNNVDGIKTVGFNQWDEEWERGQIDISTGQIRPADDTICSKNFLRVIPNTTYHYKAPTSGHSHIYEYDKDYRFIGMLWSKGDNNFTTSQNCEYIKFTCGSAYYPLYTYNHDICINLSHSGIRNGEYEPYKENYRALPDIKKYFPDGMKSAGIVYDEITSEKAIQRIGVRAYVDGDESDTSVTTDGTNTNYAIPEPIETPLEEPIQLDYVVEDWGTEEAISDEPSTPFKADIVYQFNAEGRIRDNSRNIEILENMVRLLQAKIQELEALLTTEVENIDESETIIE